MKNMLFASVALLFATTATGFAATPAENLAGSNVQANNIVLQMLADNDGEGGGGDDNGGGGSDDGASHDSNDDHGGNSASNDDNDDNDGDDDGAANRVKKPASLMGKSKRVPGGKGCDSARDKAEHPECSAG